MRGRGTYEARAGKEMTRDGGTLGIRGGQMQPRAELREQRTHCWATALAALTDESFGSTD